MRTWDRKGAALVAMVGLVTLGLGLRSFHYLRDPSVWHDEAWLILNVLHKDFGQLCGRLDEYRAAPQAAPPLFLWSVKLASITLGDGTYSLRLVPFLASCASLPLVAFAAWRWLRPESALVALSLVACSDTLLWHACETKPYACDVLVQAAFLALYARIGALKPERQFVACAAVLPVCMALSYPASFLAGGVTASLLPTVYHEKRVRTWLAYLAMSLAVVIAGILLWAGPIRAQQSDVLVRYWDELHHFPDWTRPWSVPLWTVISCLGVVRYCAKPIGQVLMPLIVVGAARLLRQGQGKLLAILLAPTGLALAAALARRYPFGCSRLYAFTAPALLLLAAEGTTVVLGWLRMRHRLAAAGLAALVLAPVGLAAVHFVAPWSREDFRSATAYVLARRSPQDAVRVDACVVSYYCRQLAPQATWPPGDRPPDRTVWVVTPGANEAERWKRVRVLVPTGWRTVSERAFDHAEVFRLEPPSISIAHLGGS